MREVIDKIVSKPAPVTGLDLARDELRIDGRGPCEVQDAAHARSAERLRPQMQQPACIAHA
jgi:hypothetical protein